MTDIITSLVSSLHYWLGFTTALVWVLVGALAAGFILRWRDPNVSPNRKRRTRPQ